MADKGELTVGGPDGPVTEAAEIRAALESGVDEALAGLARNGLLMGGVSGSDGSRRRLFLRARLSGACARSGGGAARHELEKKRVQACERNVRSLYRQTGRDFAPEIDRKLYALLSSGKTIEAIKLYREQTGKGLKESKDAIEAIMRGEQPRGF